MNTLLGSSTLSVPFGFPDSDIAERMSLTVPTSAPRTKQLLVFYWDGIEAGVLHPFTSTTTENLEYFNYMAKKGVSKQEAAAFKAAMLTLGDASWISKMFFGDRSWLTPSWSYATDAGEVVADVVKSGGAQLTATLPIGKILLYGFGALLVYGAVTSGAKGFFGKVK